MADLKIFVSGHIPDMSKIKSVIAETYGLNVMELERLDIIKKAYNKQRGQFDAGTLLEYLVRVKRKNLALWIVDKDIYQGSMNFVFGLASYGAGTVLSIYRLNTVELIRKEAVHEIGHVLGLEHCRNYCVMQFSNSLQEAIAKPQFLCKECKEKLKRLLQSNPP